MYVEKNCQHQEHIQTPGTYTNFKLVWQKAMEGQEQNGIAKSIKAKFIRMIFLQGGVKNLTLAPYVVLLPHIC